MSNFNNFNMKNNNVQVIQPINDFYIFVCVRLLLSQQYKVYNQYTKNIFSTSLNKSTLALDVGKTYDLNAFIFLSKVFPIENIISSKKLVSETKYDICVVSLFKTFVLPVNLPDNVRIKHITVFDILSNPSILREIILNNPDVFLVFQGLA
jgi:hypothetical protein